MHPEIRKFASDYFYHGQLLDAISVSNESTDCDFITKRDYFKQTELLPVCFYDLTNSRESRVGHSYSNPTEIQFAMKLLYDMYHPLELQATASSEDGEIRETILQLMTRYIGSIGIITPYKSQVTSFKSQLISLPRVLYDAIEVNTVDGFQGREKDMIIFSCVRTGHESKGIGFLSDERRLNVAITRARQCLVMLGSASHLRQDETWDCYLRSLNSRGMLKKRDLVVATSSM